MVSAGGQILAGSPLTIFLLTHLHSLSPLEELLSLCWFMAGASISSVSATPGEYPLEHDRFLWPSDNPPAIGSA